MTEADARSKSILVLVKASPADLAQDQRIHLYALSSFLLGKGNNALFWYKGLRGVSGKFTTYSDFWMTPIGQPLASYYKASNVYQRDFTGGKVLVNPTDTGQTFVVSLPEKYRNLDGQLVTSVALAPKTGVILTKVAEQLAPVVIFNSPANCQRRL